MFLTITNPTTILSFAAIFAGLGLGSMGDGYFSASVLVFGVFCGSAAWWLILSSAVDVFRRKLSETTLSWVNKLSAPVIFAFGAIALLKFLGK